MPISKSHSLFNSTIVISSLGYFVDIYDLILFSIVRIPSLKSIGIASDELMSKGVTLLNLQMGGMLLGVSKNLHPNAIQLIRSRTGLSEQQSTY